MGKPLLDLLADYAALNLLSADTVRLHEIGIRRFSESLGHPATTDDFTDLAMSRHISARITAGKSRATVNSETCKLFALWRFAAKLRIVEQWPTVKAPKMPDRIPVAWSREELARVVKATELSTPVGDVPGFRWWGALLAVLWDSGERISAVLSIGWEHVDLDAGTLLVPAEHRKGGTRDRLYRIAPETVALLNALPRDRAPFHWPYSESLIWIRYARMLKLAGLPHDRRSKFHRIRRSVASHVQAAGGDASAALDHSSPAITKRSYIDPRIAPSKQPVDWLFRPGA